MSIVNEEKIIKEKKFLTENYKQIKNSAEIFVRELSFKIIELIKTSIDSEFYSFNENNLLQNKDEEIFESCKNIYTKYSQVLNIYDENNEKIISEEKKEILNGLKEILESQIDFFFESSLFAGENPIYTEKRKIIISSINKFESKFYKYVKRYYKYNFPELENFLVDKILEDEDIFIIYNDLSKDIIDKFISFIYDDLLENKIECLENINNLDKRKKTICFFEIIKQEHDILSSIIKIQVENLELKKSSEENEEEQIIKEMLDILRETYQYTSKEVEILTGFLLKVENNEMIIKNNVEEYQKNIELYLEKCSNSNFLELIKYNIAFKNKNEKFFRFLNEEVVFDINKNIGLGNIRQDEKDKARQNVKISKDTSKAMKVLVYYFDGKNTELKDKEFFEIINGINETIKMKVEIMEETIEEFSEEILILLDEISNYKIKISNEEIKKLIQISKKNWIENYNIYDSEEVLELTLESLRENEDYINILENNLRQINNTINKIDKNIVRYKNQYIFTEIITFEEIEKYSIEKLKESSVIEVKNYIKIFYKSVNYINLVLNRNNIQRIIPKEKDIFDSKIHEILIAEKRQGFEKGEIIKPTSYGFIKDDYIYMRAKVIAAK